jgi:hypothetical protein
MRPGLLKPQREASKLPRQRSRKLRIVFAFAAVRVGPVQQEFRSGGLVECGDFKLSHPGGKIRRARGNNDMATFEARHELRHLGNGSAVVDVVEDYEPSRVGLEPAQDGGDLGGVVTRLFLWQVKIFEGR